MTGLHDPAFGVRRVLWLAYGVLGVALIFFIAAIVMFRDHLPAFIHQPPAIGSPGASPALTPNPAAGTPTGGGAQTGSDPARAHDAGGGGQLTQTGGTHGEPPGDIEDDPRGGSGSGGSGSIPPATPGGGTVPPVTVPNPAVPTLPPAVVPSARPSVLPSLVPTALPSPPI